jgi:hypothetical protein
VEDFAMRVFTFSVVAAMLLGVCVPVLGDGKAFRGRDFSSLSPVEQGEQRALILHRGGVEKMLIAVSLEFEDEDNGLWIFPVPGEPDNVKLDVLDSFPDFRGVDPRVEARRHLSRTVEMVLGTQIYTVPIMRALRRVSMIAGRGGKLPTIHAEIEKWGIHAEVITAESVEDFASYLKDKEVGIDSEELGVFQDYLSEQYVLVVVWISSREKLLAEFPEYGRGKGLYKTRWPCLFVEFATERAFYPLRPTSGYGHKIVPIQLRVIGYVAPDTGVEFAKGFRVRYYKQKGSPYGMPAEFNKALPAEDIRYTSISYHHRAEELTEDLWLTPVNPKGMKYAEAIVEGMENKYIYYGFVVCIVLAVSYVSAGCAGLALFRRWKGYARLGLWNVLTLFAFYIATEHVKGPVGERLRGSGEKAGRGTFVVYFSIFFVAITVILRYFLLGPLEGLW